MHTLPNSRIAIVTGLALMIAPLGCSKHEAEAVAPPEFSAADLPSNDAIVERIDKVLEFTLNNRRLNTRDHAAWQIVHGVLAFGGEFQIEHDGQLVSALDWLLQGGTLRGWNIRPGGPNDKGPIPVLEPGSKEGQGHPDQWLGYLSQTGMKLDENIMAGGRKYTIGDLLEQAKWDIYDGMEATWTLMAFSVYLPIDAQWQNKRGQQWNLERVVAMEAAQLGPPEPGKLDAGDSACGGSHRLFGLTVMVNKYLRDTGKKPDELTGGWKHAHIKIQDAKRVARQFQQPDGTFSAHYFNRPGTTADISERIGTTGHAFEMLATAMTLEELKQPWMRKAADQLCLLLEQTQDIKLDVGGLYHAAHGLFVYRQKLKADSTPQVSAAAEPLQREAER
jgi:hypothetical protein